MAAIGRLGAVASEGAERNGAVHMVCPRARCRCHREERARAVPEASITVTSAIDRLRSLPEAFTFAAFRRLTGFSENAAAVCLHRWKRKHLIEPAGERTGIYFNKLKNPQADTALRVEALLYEYPS